MNALVSDLRTLASIGVDPAGGITRLAWTEPLEQAIAWCSDRMADAGLETRRDAAGNLIGCWGPAAGPAVVVGSHLDTVPSGGAYDGALGVLAGIAAVRELRASGWQPARPVWVVAFMDEEGVRFGAPLFGSRSFSGEDLTGLLARADSAGITLDLAMAACGRSGRRLPEAAAVGQVGDYLELHIEQGPVLERDGADIGIVTAITGRTGLDVRLAGQAQHAGAAPMDARRDALVAAARITAAVRDLARCNGFVATVGALSVVPGAPNVVPGAVSLTIDVRADDAESQDLAEGLINAEITRLGANEGVVATTRVSDSRPPVPLSGTLGQILREESERLGAVTVALPSGAVHDAAALAPAVRAGMALVPSAGGVSHAPSEHTDPAQLEMGARVIAGALRRLTAPGAVTPERARARRTCQRIRKDRNPRGGETQMRGTLARRSALIALAASAVVIGACGSSDSGSATSDNGKEIVVGAAIAQTGVLNFTDVPGSKGAEVAVKDINAKGGVDGKKLKLIVADTKSDRAIGPQAALELINKGAQVLIVSCDFDYGSPAALAAQSKGIVSMSLCAGEPRFGPEGIGKLAFSAGVATNGEGAAGAQFAYKDKGWRTAYTLLDPTLVYDKYWVFAFQDAFKKLGGTVVGQDTFENADASIASQITRLRNQSPAPDVIAMCSYPPGGASAIKQIRAAGIDTPIVACVGMDGDYWAKAVPGLSNVYQTAYGSITGRDSNQAANRIQRAVVRAGTKPLTSHFLEGYTSVELIVRGLQADGGSTDGKKLAAAMETFTDLPVTLGKVTFNGRYHVPLKREVAINSVENGKTVFVTRVTPVFVPEPRTK